MFREYLWWGKAYKFWNSNIFRYDLIQNPNADIYCSVRICGIVRAVVDKWLKRMGSFKIAKLFVCFIYEIQNLIFSFLFRYLGYKVQDSIFYVFYWALKSWMAEKENLSWLSGRYSFQKFLQQEMADGYIISGEGLPLK